MFNPIRHVNCVLLAMAVLAVVGCSSTTYGPDGRPIITAASVHGDMSPELDTIALSRGQSMNRIHRTIDTDLRQVPDDMTALWLLDRPSRMSRYPVP